MKCCHRSRRRCFRMKSYHRSRRSCFRMKAIPTGWTLLSKNISVYHLRKSCKRACKPYVSVSVRALVSDAYQNSGRYFRQRKRKRSLTGICHRLLEFRKRSGTIMLHLSTIFFTCYVPSYERLRKSVVAYEESRPLTLALALILELAAL